MNNVLNNRYQLLEEIGNGKFGVVYKGLNIKNKNFVAIKTEKNSASIKLLKNETTVLKYLYDHGSRVQPIVYWFGVNEKHSFLVMSYYESSLYDYCNQSELSYEKIDKIMGVCIDILETVHEKFIIHRDIKPQNFMVSNNELYLIDFGFSTFYIKENGEHIEPLNIQNIVGTLKYVSYFIHEGNSASRRDDLMSLGYLYIYLYCKELPWDTLKTHDSTNNIMDEINILHDKNLQRKALKSWIILENICIKINQKIQKFLSYCYRLKYDTRPNYEELKKLFH
jgi:serine/threonine protein kinase